MNWMNCFRLNIDKYRSLGFFYFLCFIYLKFFYIFQVERKVEDGKKLYQTMPENLPSISSQTSDTQPLSSQSSLDRSDSRENSEIDSPNHQTNRGNDSSVTSTPTHSIGSSSSTDTPIYHGTPNRNGTLRRVEYFDNLEKNISNNRSISTDDSWIEKGLNRSMSGPDCLQRHRTDSDTDSVNSLQFREDDNMTMSTDSGLEVLSNYSFAIILFILHYLLYLYIYIISVIIFISI